MQNCQNRNQTTIIVTPPLSPRTAPLPPLSPRRRPPRPRRQLPPLPLRRRASPPLCPPLRRPFFPSGRSKAQRWEDSSPPTAGSEEPPSPPPRPSYRDVVASRPALVERASSPAKAKPPPCRALTSIVGLCFSSLSKAKSDGWIKVESRRARRRRLLQVRPTPPPPTALSRGPPRQVL
jgi:hypothetical protein